MRRLDRLLIGAALVLVVAIAVDALRGHDGGRRPSTTATPAATATATVSARSARPAQLRVAEAPVPVLVHQVPSTTAFMPTCPTRSLSLRLAPGPVLVLRFSGSRCHVPPLHLRALVRDGHGRLVYSGPALAHEELSGNYAGEGVARARLAAGCRASPERVVVTGSGLSAAGAMRCSSGRTAG